MTKYSQERPAEVEEKSFPDSVFLSKNKEPQIPSVLPLYVGKGIVCIYKSQFDNSNPKKFDILNNNNLLCLLE